MSDKRFEQIGGSNADGSSLQGGAAVNVVELEDYVSKRHQNVPFPKNTRQLRKSQEDLPSKQEAGVFCRLPERPPSTRNYKYGHEAEAADGFSPLKVAESIVRFSVGTAKQCVIVSLNKAINIIRK